MMINDHNQQESDKPLVVCDIGITLLNKDLKISRPLLLKKLVEFKGTGTEIVMATDGDDDFAQGINWSLQHTPPLYKSPFTDLISCDTFGHKKDTAAYWIALLNYIKRPAKKIILIDDLLENRNLAEKQGIWVVSAREDKSDKSVTNDFMRTYNKVLKTMRPVS